MGEKGRHVVVDPGVLIPAVTYIRMTNQQIESNIVALKGATDSALKSGWWQGERLAGQAEAAEQIQQACVNLGEVFADLAPAAQSVYERYLNAETRAGIDRQVSDAMSAVGTKGRQDALRKK